MLSKQIDYLINDVVFNDIIIDNISDITYRIDDGHILIYNSTKLVYIEDVFDFDLHFLDNFELEILNDILLNFKTFDVLSNKYEYPFFKFIYFFINERYLDISVVDKHQRICSNSIKEDYKKYLEIPITDILIRGFLFKINANLKFSFSFNLTCDYDILNFWSSLNFIGKSNYFLRLFMNFDLVVLYKQFKSLLLSKYFKNFNYYLNNKMYYLEKTKNNDTIKINNYAFILIDYTNVKYDFKNKFNKSIINFFKSIQSKGVVLALHPSYDSSKKKELFKVQYETFNKLFNLYPSDVRYHYLRLDYLNDLYILENNDIKCDFSFGFPDTLLFRGGTTKRFKMWSIEESRSINVNIVPLSIMDGTLFDYLGMDRESNLQIILDKLEISFKFGFEISTLIHNNGMTKYASKKDISYNLNRLILQFVKDKMQKENVI